MMGAGLFTCTLVPATFVTGADEARGAWLSRHGGDGRLVLLSAGQGLSWLLIFATREAKELLYRSSSKEMMMPKAWPA